MPKPLITTHHQAQSTETKLLIYLGLSQQKETFQIAMNPDAYVLRMPNLSTLLHLLSLNRGLFTRFLLLNLLRTK